MLNDIHTKRIRKVKMQNTEWQSCKKNRIAKPKKMRRDTLIISMLNDNHTIRIRRVKVQNTEWESCKKKASSNTKKDAPRNANHFHAK